MERSPKVVDNTGIETVLGTVDVEVDIEGLREYLIKEAGENARVEKLDELTISFGKRSYKDVLAEQLANCYLENGFPEGKALKNARWNATVADRLHSLFTYFSPRVAGLQASENSPFLYFNTPYIVKRKGIDYMGSCWNHEIDHLVDYLGFMEPELLAENRRMWKTALWVTGGVFTLFEASLVNIAFQIEDNLAKAFILVPYTGMSLVGGLAGGILTRDLYYHYFHKHEKKTARIEKTSEANQFLKLAVR